MLDYIINSGLCLAFFYGFYKLFLEKDKNHLLKRFYLLGMILLSFGIPFITFTSYIEVAPQETITFSDEVISYDTTNNIIIPTTKTNYTSIILWSIYVLGVIIFSIQFIYNLSRIYLRIKKNPKQQYHEFTHVLLQDLMAPHTFFNYIFFNKTKFETDKIPKEVHLHEQAHANQKHSLDILFIEVLKVVFWFNPLIYFIKYAIKLNHEFLADQAVLNDGITTSNYQQILLSFTVNKSHTPLANAINYSSIKKRFTVMKTPTSKNKLWIKSLLILPLIAILLVAFSQKETVEKEIAQIQENTTSIQSNETEGVSAELMKEYNDFMEFYKKNNSIMMNKYVRAVSIYDLMSAEQRISVEKYPKTPPFDLTKTKPKKPTLEQFESWKDSKTFALWLDGKVIKNTVLDDLAISDVYHFFGSGVANNARSERFPQPYQFHLYSEKHYENTIVKANLNSYNRLVKTYDTTLRTWLKSDRSNNSELKIQKIQIDKSYNKFSEKELKEWDVKIAPPLPAIKNKSVQKTQTSTEKKPKQEVSNIEGVTQERIVEYQNLANKLNAQSKDSPIKAKVAERMWELYAAMSVEQKKNFGPSIVSNEAEIKLLLKKYNEAYINFSNSDRKDNSKIIELKNQLESYYAKITMEQMIIFKLGPILPPMAAIKPNKIQRNVLPPPVPASKKDSNQAIPILPKKASQNDSIKIIINKLGDYLVDGEYSYLDKITEKIKGFSLEERKELIVNVISDPNTPVKWVEYLKTMLHKNDVSKVNFEIRNTTSKATPNQKTSEEKLDPQGDIPFANLDMFPVYPGCTGDNQVIKACFNKSMQIHIAKKFNSKLAKTLGLSSGKKKIYAQLRISKTGKIEIIGIRSPHDTLDEEMKRIINLYPKVIPGKYNGEAVSTTYMIPVTFTIE